MPDIKYKLHYRGVNWGKVEARAEKRWAEKASPVEIVSAGDPEKIKAFKQQRQAQGLNVTKKKKNKKKRKYRKSNL